MAEDGVQGGKQILKNNLFPPISDFGLGVEV